MNHADVVNIDAVGCRWRLMGDRWQPGCNAPPISYEGIRGDYAAINRAMRRAQAKRGTS